MTKQKSYQPKSIEEAIDMLQIFLECDLYTKFRPEEELPSSKKGRKKIWYRKDFFKNESEFWEYLKAHFKILEQEIIKGIGKRKYKEEFRRKI